MNRSILLGTLAAVAASALPVAAQAESAYTTSALNVRAGPGPEYPIVTALPVDADVEIYACLEGRTWCDVTAASARGWVSGESLAYSSDGAIVAEARVEVPVASYDTATYWDQYYADRDFYAQRDQFAGQTTVTTRSGQSGEGALAGAATGATAGAIVGGPVGAAIGGAAGALTGAALEPPETVTTYVTRNRVEPVVIERQVEVGVALPDRVVLHRVPDYEYQYTYVNDRPVLVDPGTRQVVYVMR
ncbi:DUF1236 domain-containing protein [Lutibaculum baratangense]|uniref:SH3b domain-containing protein n=1 Tax=Lutibaculum baratangense AMV1 TaxID=631454 RepID=V4RCX0_9HYPH|nr:DUF1236 domain-containing protein [Lutibaculum baratangense]ESR23244.1 hypothetical protein N177_3312 [Lutibaculum baratangense AMV1]